MTHRNGIFYPNAGDRCIVHGYDVEFTCASDTHLVGNPIMNRVELENAYYGITIFASIFQIILQ